MGRRATRSPTRLRIPFWRQLGDVRPRARLQRRSSARALHLATTTLDGALNVHTFGRLQRIEDPVFRKLGPQMALSLWDSGRVGALFHLARALALAPRDRKSTRLN